MAYLDRIIVKKTKVQIITEENISSYNTKSECFKSLILNSLITGASGNSLKQISRAGVEQNEFEAIKEAQKEFENIKFKLENKLSLILDNAVINTHKFH